MKYPRAPITEAVLEMRFTHTAAQDAVEKAAKTISKGTGYFYSDPEDHLEFSVDVASGSSSQRKVASGIKLSYLDRSDILIFRTNAFVCSRLAPYQDFETFIERAKHGWAAWTGNGGNNEISRIGLRY